MSSKSRVVALCAGFVVCSSIVIAGPPAPPPGPVSSSYKTLDEVQPRIPVNALPGNATASHVVAGPGSFYLTDTIIGEVGKYGIEIDMTNGPVTLDLNGFSLIGVPGAMGAIGVVDPSDGLVIRAGAVRDWPGSFIAGITEPCDDVANVLEDLTISDMGGDGINLSSMANSLVRNVTVQTVGGDGIRIAAGGTIEHCVVAGAAGNGIDFGDDPTQIGSARLAMTVRDTEIRDVLGVGILFSGIVSPTDDVAGVIERVRIQNTGSHGVDAHPQPCFLVADVFVQRTGADGIRVGPGAKLLRVHPENVPGFGIVAGAYSRIEDSRLTYTNAMSMQLDEHCTVENTIIHSAFEAQTGLTLRNNVISGDLDNPLFQDLRCLGGLHLAEHNRFELRGTNFDNLPAMTVGGDGSVMRDNTFILASVSGNLPVGMPHLVEMTGSRNAVVGNVFQGIPDGAGAIMLMGDGNVVTDNTFIGANGQFNRGITADGAGSLLARNTFLRMGLNGVPIVDPLQDDLLGPAVTADVLGTNSSPDRNVEPPPP